MSGNFLIALRYLFNPSFNHSIKNHLAFVVASNLKPRYTISKVADAFSEARAIHHIYWNIILGVLISSLSIGIATAFEVLDFELRHFLMGPLMIMAGLWISYAVFYGLSVFVLQSQASTRRHIAAFSSISSVALSTGSIALIGVILSSDAISLFIITLASGPTLFLFVETLSKTLQANAKRAAWTKGISISGFGMLTAALLVAHAIPVFQGGQEGLDQKSKILSDRSLVSLHCQGRISLGKEIQGCIQFPELKDKVQEKMTKAYCDQYVDQGKIEKGPCPLQRLTSSCRSTLGGAEIYSYDESETLKVHCTDLKMGTFVVLDDAEAQN